MIMKVSKADQLLLIRKIKLNLNNSLLLQILNKMMKKSKCSFLKTTGKTNQLFIQKKELI